MAGKDQKPIIHTFTLVEHPRHVDIPILDDKKIQSEIICSLTEQIKKSFGKDMIQFIKDQVKQAVKEATKDIEVVHANINEKTVDHYKKNVIPYDFHVPVKKEYDHWIPVKKSYTKWEAEIEKYKKYEAVREEYKHYIPVEVSYNVMKPKVVEEPYPVKVPKVIYENEIMPKYVLREKTIWVRHERIEGAKEI